MTELLEDRRMMAYDIADVTVTEGNPTDLAGSLSPARETDLYRFTLPAGRSLAFESLNVSIPNAGTWTLFGPSNAYVASAGLDDDFNAVGLQAGEYTLAVEGNDVGTSTSYELRITDRSGFDVSPEGFGAVQNGTLLVGGSQSYSFDAPAGYGFYFDSLDVDADGVTYEVKNPAGTTIFSGSAAMDSEQSILSESGTYTIILHAGPAGGDYRFRLLNPSSVATPLTLGALNQGATTGLETKVHSFTGVAGQRLIFDGRLASSDVTITLTSPSGNSVLYYQGASIDHEPITLAETGTYLMYVRSSEPDAPYEYRLSDVGTLPTLTLNSTVNGALNSGFEADAFRINGVKNQRLYLDMLSTSAYYDATWYLYGPGNEYLGSSYFYQGGGDFEALPLSRDGVYVLSLWGNRADAIDYSIQVSATATQVLPLTVGNFVVGEITQSGEQDVYTFTGSVGQKLVYDGYDNDFDGINVTIYDPYGNYLVSQNADGDQPPFTLTAAGTYRVVLDGSGATVGDYRFRLLDVAAQPILPLDMDVVNRQLNPGTTAEVYRLTAAVGDRYYFDLQSSNAYYDATWALYGPHNETIASNYFYSSSGDLNVGPLEKAGNYTFVIWGAKTTEPVEYDFHVTTPQRISTPITLGALVSGTIAESGEIDELTFTGTAGQRLVYDGETVAGSENVSWQLLSPSGLSVVSGSGPYDDFAPFTLPEAGTYRLVVSSYGPTTGGYQFRLLDVAAQPVVPLDTIIDKTGANALSPEGTHVYRFSGAVGDRRFIDLVSTALPYPGYWRLYSPQNVAVAGNYTYAASLDLEPAPFTVAGEYVLVVRDFSGGGEYSFQVVTPTVNAAPLTLGATVSGAISEPGEIDEYTFTGTAGQRLLFDSLESTYLPAAFQLIAPSGEIIGVNYNGGTGDHGPFTLKESGAYRLQIDGSGDVVGNYSFRLLDLASATSLSLDTLLENVPHPVLRSHLYRFTGTAGQRLFLEYSDPGLGVRIIGPGDASIPGTFYGDGVTAAFEPDALPTSGTYYLIVAGNDEAAVTPYSLQLRTTSTSTTPLTIGTSVTGTIAGPGEIDEFTFTGTAGQRLVYDALTSNITPITATLIGPDGQNAGIAYDSDAEGNPFTLTHSGMYRLRLDAGSWTTGDYGFRLLDVASQPVVSMIAPNGGTLSPGDSAKVYRLNATAGQKFTFTSNGVDAGSQSTWQLFDPHGASLGSANLTTPFTAQTLHSGTCVLVLWGRDATPTSYLFQVADVSEGTVPISGLDAPFTGTLAPSTQQVFGFTASAGERLYFDSLDATYPGCDVELYDPSNDYLLGFSARNDYGPFTLARSGNYAIRVTNNQGDPQNFAFRFLALSNDVTPLALGALQTGTLPGLEAKIYSFTGAIGQRLVLDGDSSGSSADAMLLSPTGQAIAYSYQYASLITLREAGTHYVIVRSSVADDTFDFRVVNVGASPSLTLDVDVTGTIAAGKQTNTYRVDLVAGQRIYFDMTDEASIGGPHYWSLYDPFDVQQAGGDFQDFEAGPVTKSGTYVLMLYNGGSPDAPIDYAFRAVSHAAAAPTPLTLNTTVDATITKPGEMDEYSFVGTAGQGLMFDGLTGVEHGDPVRVSLVDPNGTLLRSDWQYYYYSSPITLPVAGTYRLRFDAVGNYTGDYHFRLLDVASQPVVAFDTTVGPVAVAALSMNVYRFDATAGQALFFNMLSHDGAYPSYWELLGPDGASVGSAGFNSAEGGARDDFRVDSLPVSGRYVLVVHSRSDAPVNYQFRIVTPTNVSSPLTLGTVVNSTIGEPGEIDEYAFTGAVGQRLFYDSLLVTNNTLRFQIYSPSGANIVSTLFDNEIAPFTLSESGTYRVVVSSNAPLDSIGAYKFRLLDVASQPSPAYDSTVTVTGNPALQSNVYRFTAAAGQRLFFDSVSSSDPDAILWQLFDPLNNSVGYGYSFADFEPQPVTLAGVYTLVFYASNSIPLDFLFRPGTNNLVSAPLTLGATVTGSFSEPGEKYEYTFTPGIGKRLIYDALDADYDGVYVSLVSPSGNIVSINGNADYDSSPIITTESGVYRLIVDATGDLKYDSVAKTGDFAFRLIDIDAQSLLTAEAINQGQLAPGVSLQAFRLNAVAGQRLFFDSLPPTAAQSGSYWYVYSPDLQYVGGTTLGIDFETNVLEKSGVYTLVLFGGDTAAPLDYKFTHYAATTVATPLTLGSTVAASIVKPGEVDEYSFTGAAGQRLYFDGLSPDADNLVATLIGPDGNVYLVNEVSTEINAGPLTLRQAGAYRLRIDGYGETVGAYSFRLLDLAAQPEITVTQTFAVFNVTRTSGASAGSVNFITAADTAGAGVDYQPVPGLAKTLKFSAGQLSRTISIPVLRDKSSETQESFFVHLSGGVGESIGDGQGVGTINDDDGVPPGITVNPISGLVTTEVGGDASFTVVLNSQPTNDVKISIGVSNAAEATVSTLELTFTSANWNVPQTVVVTGKDDSVDDGDIAYTVVTGAAVSSDPSYSGRVVSDVSLTNLDNDTFGVVVNPLIGLVTTEAGGDASFTVVLTSQPTADVTIPIASLDATEGTASVAQLTFTAANWNVAQTVIVTGVNDDLDDGDVGYTVQVGAATSGDANYQGLNPSDVVLTNTDNDSTGILVTPTSGLVTTEAGGTASFTVRLNSQPTANVVIAVASLNAAEGTPSAASLTFTPANWNQLQTVTVTGVNDDFDDGDKAYVIQLDAAVSTDATYGGLNPSDVSVLNQDDDSAGFIVTPSAGLITTEAGGAASFTVRLTSRPTVDVTIAVASLNAAEGTTSKSFLTFTTNNWNTPQSVTVTGVNDDVDDGDVAYAIQLGAASSGDPSYSGLDPIDVAATNTDDDTFGVLVTPTSGLVTTEAGGTASFSVKLNSRPTADVTIPVSSLNTAEGTVLPVLLTFTSANWNVAQNVAVTGVNDDVDDGDIAYVIQLGAASSSDLLYNNLNPADVAATNTDDDTFGVLVTPTSGLITTEAGGTASFSVVLNSKPTGNVTIPVSSLNTAEGTVLPVLLTFTPANWNVAQNVTITGVNDNVDDGDVAYTIQLAPASSSDPLYNNLNPADVAATNVDNDTAGIVVTPTSGLITTEAGGTASFNVKLDTQPSGDVVIRVTSSDTSEGTVGILSVTFTPINWNVPQTVVVTGVDDALDDGDIAYTIALANATSTDPNYNGLNPSDVAVTNTDDDGVGVIVTPQAGLLTTEAGGQAQFTVKLNSQPTADVTIPVASSNLLEGTVAITSLLFTPANWNVAQTVVVTGVDDFTVDGSVLYSIQLAAAASADPSYNGIDPTDVLVNNTDDDTPGFIVTPVAGLVTTEAGGEATFTIALKSRPTGNVIIPINSLDPTEGSTAPSITFTPSEWNVPKTVTVTGVDDDVDDGDIAYVIQLGGVTSVDPVYNGLKPADVSALNRDDDTAGFTVSPAAGLVTTEAGGTATFQVRLDSQPSADVTLAVASLDATEGSVSAASITFTAANWNVPKLITVTGIDDALDDGDVLYSIQVGASTSADPKYSGLAALNVGARNTDDDGPLLTVELDFTTKEEGGIMTGRILRNGPVDTALTVVLSSPAGTQVNLPVVTIPVGQSSAPFTIQTIQNTIPEKDETIDVTASAAGYSDAANSFLLTDHDDLPTLTITPSSASTAENGAGFTFTVSRAVAVDSELTVRLETGDANVALPEVGNVVIPANALSATFVVRPVNNALVDGTRSVTVSAFGSYVPCGCKILVGVGSAMLDVIDDEAPSLQLDVDRTSALEGTTDAFTLRATRNTSTAADLVVTLTSGDPALLIAPATLTIPAGESFATVKLHTGIDGISAGPREILLTAQAPGLPTSSVRLTVIDIDSADLRVTNVIAPSAGISGDSRQVAFSVTNGGSSATTHSWVERVYFSLDATFDVGDVLASERTVSTPLAAGATVGRTDTVSLPNLPGTYYTLVLVDADAEIPEPNEADNFGVAASTTVVRAIYSASVSTATVIAPNGTTVHLSGHATLNASGTPAANVPVTVRIIADGAFRRVLTATTNAAGDYQVDFIPLPFEAGHYDVAADHPDVPTDTVQDQFKLVGMRIDPDSLAVRVAPGTPLTGTLTLGNLGSVALNGLAASMIGAPASITVTAVPRTNSLSGNGEVIVDYTVAAADASVTNALVRLRFTSTEGAVREIPVTIQVVPLTPLLTSNPGVLIDGVVRGGQKVVNVTVTNIGGAPSGDLEIQTSSGTPWLTLAGPQNIPSLAPGESTTLTLVLTPPADAPLGIFDGTISLVGATSNLDVPFEIRTLSDAKGDFRVAVEDEFTYYAAGAPLVADARVIIRDPYDNSIIIAEGRTAADGRLTLPQIPEGNYLLEIQADKHGPYQKTVVITAGGLLDMRAFLRRQTVSYSWNVQPTVIPDTYTIKLRSTFETNVPAPVVTVTAPDTLPPLNVGETAQVELTVTNHGLIAAENIRLEVPQHEAYEFITLSNEFGTLPAKSELKIPMLIRGKISTAGDSTASSSAKSATSAHTNTTANGPVQSQEVFSACVAAGFLIRYLYFCGEPRESTAIAIMGFPVFALACLYDTIIIPAQLFGGGGGGGGGNGGGGGGGGGYRGVSGARSIDCDPFATSSADFDALLQHQASTAAPPHSTADSVCAQVQIEIVQTAVVARSAFEGGLTIDNSSPDLLEGIKLELEFRDEEGTLANDRFAIIGPELDGLTAVDGTGVVLPGAKGSARYTFIPTREAAPDAPKRYLVSGFLSYIDPGSGRSITVPLLGATITVMPDPLLRLDYFQERIVVGDDPFTVETEPSVPFALGLIATNVGRGTANDFTITSAQPKIIENEKGLLIDFKIIGSQVGDQPVDPSLTVDLGDLEFGQSRVATWLLTSSLEGLFTEYSATYTHDDALGGMRTSIIDTLTIHELFHRVRGDRPTDDTVFDFLVNDVPDAESLPDKLYLSNGTTAPVNVATNVLADGVVSPADRRIRITANQTSGWSYLQLADPGAGWKLSRVVRSDGKEIDLGENAWQTSKTYDAGLKRLVSNPRLHIFDFDGTGDYTAFYVKDDSIAPSVVLVQPISPDPRSTPVSEAFVEFSEEIDLATFDYQDLSLTRNGGANLVTSAVTVEKAAFGTATYRIGGLSGLTLADGAYVLTVLGAGVTDFGDNAALGSAATDWTNGSAPPFVKTISPVTPAVRNTPVGPFDVTTSQAIFAASFDFNDLSLTRDGFVIALDATVLVTPVGVDGTDFQVAGLDAFSSSEGNYVLTISGAGLQNLTGTAGIGAKSVAWTIDVTAPQLLLLEQPATTPRNIVVPGFDVRFSESIDLSTFTRHDFQLRRDGIPVATDDRVMIAALGGGSYRVTGLNWFMGEEGSYALQLFGASVTDPAGNAGTGVGLSTWIMDTTRPAVPSELAITPDGGIPADGKTFTGALAFSGKIGETGLTVRLYDTTTDTDIGPATVDGLTFQRDVSLTAGLHRLRARAVDAAGNTADSFFDVFVDLVAPTATLEAIAPNPRTLPVSTIDVTFSESIFPESFTADDLRLKLNGGVDLVDGGVTIEKVSDTLYRIHGLSALTASEGDYVFTLLATAVVDENGNAGTSDVSVAWHVNGTGGGTPGFTVVPTSGLNTTENGGFDMFAVWLTSAPTADVTIPVVSSNPDEGRVSTALLTFTPSNWDQPQQVIVTGADDAIADGNIAYTIVLGAATSADLGYQGLDPSDVSATNADNDTARLTLVIAPNSIAENGGSAIGTVTRNTPTTADLIVTLVSGDTTEATVPATVTIPAGKTSATFTVTAVDDVLAEGDVGLTIGASAPGFAGVLDSLTVVDNETPTLSLLIAPNSIAENGGAAIGTVLRNTPSTSDLVVTLGSSDTTEASVPATVTIPAGQTSATFTVAAVDDAIADGNQVAVITASLAGFLAGSDSLTVVDNETPRLTVVVLPNSIAENGGSAIGTVTRNTPTTGDLIVNLASGDTTEASVPSTVTIPAGQTSATFTVAAVDDAIADGNQVAVVSVSAPGFTGGSDAVAVIDNETPRLTLSIAPTAISESGGSAVGTVTRNTPTTSDLTVNLGSNDTTEATVPATVVIPAGQTSATFTVTAVDDLLLDGNQVAFITASSPGFSDGGGSLTVTDNESPQLTLSIAPASISESGGTAVGTVTRSTPAVVDLVVSLTSSDTTEATVPATVTIPAGRTSASFNIAAVDDALFDGNQVAVITASSLGFSSGVGSLTVTDDEASKLTISVAPNTLAENGGTATAAVARTGPTTSDLVVTLFSSDTTEATVPVTVVIPAGQSSTTFTVSAVDDALSDGNVGVSIGAMAPGVSGGSYSITVLDDESIAPPPEVNLLLVKYAATETGETAQFRVTRSNVGADLAVYYTASGQAKEGIDFVALPGFVVIPAGASEAVITVEPIDDALLEGLESIVLNVKADASYVLGAKVQASAAIHDDEKPTVSVSSLDGVASEGSPADPGTFRIRRTSTAGSALSVPYSLIGTASNGADYELLSGTALIPAGSDYIDVAVTPLDDADSEGTETVTLRLIDQAGYQISVRDATITLYDDDRPTVSAVAVRNATESSGSNGTIRISRPVASATPLTVRYSLSGAAENGVDYETLSGTAVIPAGELFVNVTIQPKNDTLFEGRETVKLALLDDGGYLVSTRNAMIYLNDLQRPTVNVWTNDTTATEGNSDTGLFRIGRSPNTSGNMTVNYVLTGTATNGVDYAVLSGAVTIPSGKTYVDLTVSALTDGLTEGPETLRLTLSPNAAYDLDPTTSFGTVTINDGATGTTASALDSFFAVLGDDGSKKSRKN